MDLTFYSQLIIPLDEQATHYSGEDAFPYSNDQIFFVADGMGSSSNKVHEHFDPALFEKDKIMDALFQGIYEDYSDERLVNYVTESFFALSAVKKCYFVKDKDKDYSILKHSGFFGSRIATAILLHKMLYDESVKPSVLFSQYNSLATPEEKEEFLKKLDQNFSNEIRTKLCEIAKKVNLFEPYKKVLLGTTLCATVYQETEKFIEAIYLMTGDSRPYLWTEKEGLSQLLKDQEGQSDGNITNWISADEGHAFNVGCKYMRFEKPCVLFNATDGCFDADPCKISQMAFEKLILEKAISSTNTVEMSKALRTYFDVYGFGDDSSTLAMKIFGYESFEAFKESAARRLDTINDLYLSKLPDLLEKDYVEDLKPHAWQLRRDLSGLKAKFEDEEAVRSISIEQMKREHFAPYEERIKAIDAQIAQQNQRIEKASIQINDIVARNFICFDVRPVCQKTFFWFNDPAYKVQHIVQERQEQTEIYINMIERYRTDLDETTARMKVLMDNVFEIGVPADFSRYDDMDMSDIEDLDSSISSLIKFFYQIKKKNNKSIITITKLRKEYIENNQKLASDNQIKLREIRDKIISGDDPRGMIHGELLLGDLEALQNCVANIREAEANIASLNTDEKKKAETELWPKYWGKNYVEIIPSLIFDTSIEISEDLRAEAKPFIEKYNERIKDIKGKADLQSELFKQYDIHYNRYIEGAE